MVNKQMQRVIGSESSEELTVRFSDLSGRCKETIFEKVVAAVAFKGGEYNYVGQMDDCKKLVRCKILCKTWNYWLTRKMVGKEMKLGLVVVD